MNNKNQFWIAIIWLLTSCSTPKEPEENVMRFKTESAVISFPSSLSTAVQSEPFHINNTAKLAAFYMNSNNSFRNVAKKYSWGGTFDANIFKLTNPNNAIRLWYCYNSDNNKYPKFFLALEQIEATNDTDKKPEAAPEISKDSLFVPKVFVYPDEITTSDAIRNFIEKHDTDEPGNLKISREDVLRYSDNFRDFLSIISPSDIGPYCKYVVAIFREGDYFREFLNRENGLTFVRYYMGLSYDPSHEPNYLRPVLAGVRSDGTTLLDLVTRTNGTFLQKSVPPPPDN
jgi:hypothetical protein